ncbi:MAG: hypothetical protein ACFBSC_09685 [Microcoleaceae cyanobacterium]
MIRVASPQAQKLQQPGLWDSTVHPRNVDALKQLNRSLAYSQGQFCLILAHCDNPSIRQQMIQQLHDHCSVSLNEIVLDQSAETLYTTVYREFQGKQPEAVMVTGLESVQRLSQLLIATNYVREEFCKFSFPIVLWVTDDVLKKLIRLVPDFFSWASAGIEFSE